MAGVNCTGKFEQTTLVECMNKSASLSDLLPEQIEAVLKILMQRDAHVLHAKLEQITNPPRSLAPAGRTTKL